MDSFGIVGIYQVIVADPPWRQMGGPLAGGVGEGFKFTGPQRSRALPYGTMTVDELVGLPVSEMAAKDAALYLWTTNAYIEAAYTLARAWGFKPSTFHTWAKNPMGGGLGGKAFGITSEYFLYARRGTPVERRVTGTWWNWKRYYVNGKPSHSSKPDGFYDLVEQVNDGPYLELFSRRDRMGWDAWGDESSNTAAV